MLAVQNISLFFYSFIGVLGVFIFIGIIVFFKRRQQWPYESVPVMSSIEKKLYWQLKEVFPRWHILAQVQLCRVIRPPHNKQEYKWLNKIWRMSLDYVILDEQLNTIVAIELDDKSHLSPKRQEADTRKTKALKAAGVQLIRIKTTCFPTNAQLKKLLEKK